MSVQPIALSVSGHFHNKENRAPMRDNRDGKPSNLWAHGAFETVRWTPEQTCDHIVSGKAICIATLKNDWRKGENFLSAQLMGIDFDNHMDVQTLLKDDFVEEYAFLIYPTASSTAEAPRSRVLFILDSPITDRKEYRRFVRRLLQRFKSRDADEQCKDDVRMFFGSTQLGWSRVLSSRLPLSVLEALPPHADENRTYEPIEAPFVTSSLDDERFRHYIDKALEDEFHALVTTGQNRNQALYVTARSVGELVGAPWTNLSRNLIEQNLFAAAQANGYTSKDGETAARATIRSGMEAGMSEPRPQPPTYDPLPRNIITITPPPQITAPSTNGKHPHTKALAPLLWEKARLSADQEHEAATGRRWLDEYMKWAIEASPLTPAIFHEAMALWLLATVSTRRMKVTIGGEDIYPNLYILIVARTTIYRKSTAMKLAKSLLMKANLSSLLLPSEATPEALFDELAGVKPMNFDTLPEDAQLRWKMGRAVAAQRSFVKDEVSSVFANLKRDYMAGLSEILLQGYDADSGVLDKRLKSKGLTTVRDLCVSFLGATTPAMYNKYVTLEEHESGLMPRFAIVTPDEDVPYRYPADVIESPDHLVNQLRTMFLDVLPWHHGAKPSASSLLTEVISPPVMNVSFAQEAICQLNLYRQAVGYEMIRSEQVDDSLSAFYARLGTMAFKIAMLLAAIDNEGGVVRVEGRYAYAAILICESWRESLHRLSRDIDKSRGGLSDDNKVLMLIRQSGEKGLTLREIMQLGNLRPRAKAVEALTILADDGQIEKYDYKPEGRGRGTSYYRLAGLGSE